MKTMGFALVAGVAAAVLSGCGGVVVPLTGDGGTSSGSGSSSGGVTSSSGGGSSGSSSSGASGSSTGGSSTGGGSSSGSGGFGSSTGGSSSGSSSGGFGSSSGGSGSSSSGGSSGSSSGGSGSSGGSSSGGGGSGYVTFEQCTGSSTLCGSGSTFELYGAFSLGTSTTGCTTTTSGACSYSSCSNPTTPTAVSAGTLTVAGGSIPGGLTLTPDTSNSDQYTYNASSALFAAGQVLTVSASGATVPAFGPVSIAAPGLGTLTAPAASAGAYTISTKADLAVRWTGGQAPAQLLIEGAGSDGGVGSYFLCEWDATLGTGTVPASILAGLAGQSGGFLIYGQMTSTSIEAGAFPVSISALQYSGGTATYQ